MKPIPDKVFLDTNVIVYLYSNDEPQKRELASALFEENIAVASTQVLREISNTLRKKFGLDYDVIADAVAEVKNACFVIQRFPYLLVML